LIEKLEHIRDIGGGIGVIGIKHEYEIGVDLLKRGPHCSAFASPGFTLISLAPFSRAI